MAYKKTFRKKRTFKKKTYKKKAMKKTIKHKGNLVSASPMTITYMVPRQLPFPPRYRTKMTCAWFGIIAAAGLDGTGLGRAYCGLNYCYTPISNSTWTISGPFSITSTVGAAALQPTGFTQICTSQLYRSYRVYSSALSITLDPTDARDLLEVSITPTINTGAPGSVTTAMALPYTKSYLFAPGKGRMSLANYQTVHRQAGVSHSAIQNDLSKSFEGLYNGTLPTTQHYWAINVAKPAAVDSFLDINYQMKLTYWVEFFDLNTGGMPIT